MVRKALTITLDIGLAWIGVVSDEPLHSKVCLPRPQLCEKRGVYDQT